jgi:type I restriction enzyme M protein
MNTNDADINQAEINAIVLRACDTFRGATDSPEYRNYVLVILFLKYLSDVWKGRLAQYRQEFSGNEEHVQRRMSRERFILPEGCDFDSIHARRNEANIGGIINTALEKIEEANKVKLEGVFRNADFNSEANLGEARDRNRRLRILLEDFADPRLGFAGDGDLISGACQSLIERFAWEAGKTGDEFSTPPEVSALLAKLLQPKKGDRICDPACGSGALLIRLAEEISDRDFALFGQESDGGTWALCRMNLFLHHKDSARIEWGDTLVNPKLLDGDALRRFDIVVAQPPFSPEKWGAETAAKDRFHRFHRGVPPRGKTDYAFITHMIETTAPETGKAGVIVPHGALFRGGAEGKIRRRLIEENLLDLVLGLPANLFYGAAIPAAILLFRRGRVTRDVLFIDASRDYEDARRLAKLRPQDIEKIVATYKSYGSARQYAHRATFEEIEANDFNLNIPRYVDTIEEEEEIDIRATEEEIERLEAELIAVRAEIKKHLTEIGL